MDQDILHLAGEIHNNLIYVNSQLSSSINVIEIDNIDNKLLGVKQRVSTLPNGIDHEKLILIAQIEVLHVFKLMNKMECWMKIMLCLLIVILMVKNQVHNF